MRVCIDTNVMLSAMAKGSPLAPLFNAITSGKLELAVSTAILFEYEENAGYKPQPISALDFIERHLSRT